MKPLTLEELFILSKEVASNDEPIENQQKVHVMGNNIIATNGLILVYLIRKHELKNGSYYIPEGCCNLLTKSSRKKIRASMKTIKNVSSLYSKANSLPGISISNTEIQESYKNAIEDCMEDIDKNYNVKPFDPYLYSRLFNIMSNFSEENRGTVYELQSNQDRGTVFIYSDEYATHDEEFNLSEICILMPILSGTPEDGDRRVRRLKNRVSELLEFKAGEQGETYLT